MVVRQSAVVKQDIVLHFTIYVSYFRNRLYTSEFGNRSTVPLIYIELAPHLSYWVDNDLTSKSSPS